MTPRGASKTSVVCEVTLYLETSGVSPLRIPRLHPSSVSGPRIGPPPDPFWPRRQTDPRHDPGPRTSTASRPGAARGQSPRRAGRRITQRARRARAHEPSRLSFLRSNRGPNAALGRDGRIAFALAEGRAPLNRRAHLWVVRPSPLSCSQRIVPTPLLSCPSL